MNRALERDLVVEVARLRRKFEADVLDEREVVTQLLVQLEEILWAIQRELADLKRQGSKPGDPLGWGE